MIFCSFLFITLSLSASSAQDLPSPPAMTFQSSQASHDDSDYQEGLRSLDARQWDKAIESFDASVSRKGKTADAALYWKAYAQNRAGQREDALATIGDLRQSYPSSRWLKDAQALELEVRSQTGAPVNPSSEPDEELKLLALNGLMMAEPDKALPVLQKLLAGSSSPKIKERALFILVQNPSPEGRKMLSDFARNSSNPDLQLKAVRYIGMMGSSDARKELASIYSSSSDIRLKQAILQGFMLSGSKEFLLNAAKTEQNPELRHDAIRQLALTGGQDELWQLYESERSPENKQAILKSMFLGGNSPKLVEIARDEKDPKLRIAAIKSLGLMGNNGQGDVLVSIYRSNQDREVRDAVLNALFLQQNGKALVDLARNEKDPRMKEEIVKKMSLVHSKEVTDYMMEVLR